MVMNRTIQVRMTKDQYERIRNNTALRGFYSMSAFMRFAALERDVILEKKIIEIHDQLFGEPRAGTKRQATKRQAGVGSRQR